MLCFQTLVIYALGVVLQDSDTWSTPYRFNIIIYFKKWINLIRRYLLEQIV